MGATAPPRPDFTSLDDDAAAQYLRVVRATPWRPGTEAVAQVEEIHLQAAGTTIRMYHPEPGELLPGLVFFHGGGWVMGNLDMNDGVCRYLANAARCAVISVDYRLAPEHPYPAALDDARACLAWIATAGAESGIDQERLAVGGSSAGGNLAAALALWARDSGGPDLKAQLLLLPAVDPTMSGASHFEIPRGYLLDREQMAWFWSQYATGAARIDPLVGPLLAVSHAALPPAIIVTAEIDPLRDEGERYGALLRASGVPVSAVRARGQVHGFLSWGSPPAILALDAAAARLGEALAGDHRALRNRWRSNLRLLAAR